LVLYAVRVEEVAACGDRALPSIAIGFEGEGSVSAMSPVSSEALSMAPGTVVAFRRFRPRRRVLRGRIEARGQQKSLELEIQAESRPASV